MKIHKEGRRIVFNSFILLAIPVTIIYFTIESKEIFGISLALALLLFFLIIRFFRAPKRIVSTPSDSLVMAPADGKVVIIKDVFESEYLKEECIQVSIFMSVFNVHVNWYPVGGVIKYYKYHPGRYFVAMYAKSSEKNERTTVVIENSNGVVLLRQIAGYIARRIVCYSKEHEEISQGDEVGFIKFGSRVDLFLPKDSRIHVTKGQRVKALQTVICTLPDKA